MILPPVMAAMLRGVPLEAEPEEVIGFIDGGVGRAIRWHTDAGDATQLDLGSVSFVGIRVTLSRGSI